MAILTTTPNGAAGRHDRGPARPWRRALPRARARARVRREVAGPGRRANRMTATPDLWHHYGRGRATSERAVPAAFHWTWGQGRGEDTGPGRSCWAT